jgi:hypothetical protein
MTINSFYPTRLSSRQVDYFCYRQPAEIARDGLEAQHGLRFFHRESSRLFEFEQSLLSAGR